MREKIKSWVVTVIFSLTLICFAFVNIVSPDLEFSKSERRKLKAFPKVTIKSVLSGDWFDEFEKYTLDQFVLRDFFRGVKAWSRYHLFFQKDNNKIYIVEGNINKMEYPLDEKSVIRGAEKLNKIKEKYFKDKNVFVAVIPDKNYFFAPLNGSLSFDYEKMEQLIKENIKDISYIDLFDAMDKDMFYLTDIHWDQEKIIPVADLILETLGREEKASDFIYEKQKLYPFYGSYYGQAAIKTKPDTLTYLTHAYLDRATVYDYETKEYTGIYKPELFEGYDPYDVFLSGARTILTIENPSNTSGKELIIFRDSFGSSIAPLLLCGYSKITLVDIRYIPYDLLGDRLDFSKDIDVLFLYNTMVFNNSAMLR